MEKLRIFIYFFLCNFYLSSIYIPKRAIKIITDKKTSFYFGIDDKDLKSSNKIDFQIDFHFCSIIVHDQIICQSNINCRVLDNSQTNQSSYKDLNYNYAKIKTFLGIQEQVTTTITTNELLNYINLPIRKLNEQHQEFSNVLGLSINSPIWQHWTDLYNFKENIIHYDIILQDGNEQIIFWNARWPLKNTWLPVSKNQQRYEWKMSVVLEFLNYKTRSFRATFTFENDKDLMFELSNDQYFQLLNELCIDQNNCTRKEHLKPHMSLKNIYFQGAKDVTQKISIEELYQINQDGKIQFFFNKYHNVSTRADVILQKRFFERYYISISNNLLNQTFYHLKINNLDTLKKRFQIKYFKCVLIFFFLSFIFSMGYAVYSKLCVRKKVLQEREREFYENVN